MMFFPNWSCLVLSYLSDKCGSMVINCCVLPGELKCENAQHSPDQCQMPINADQNSGIDPNVDISDQCHDFDRH